MATKAYLVLSDGAIFQGESFGVHMGFPLPLAPSHKGREKKVITLSPLMGLVVSLLNQRARVKVTMPKQSRESINEP